jgi:hypothetical protein
MRKSRAAAIIALIAWGGGLCLWVWSRTGDILGDFGHEMYVAWQLSQGKVFARDVAYLCGPLSPWINALWMRIFGANLNVILTFNALVLVGTAALLYRVILQAASELAAFAATAFFVAVFGLCVGTRDTNYNFLTPYAHGVTHGLLLCLGTAMCLCRFQRAGGVRWSVTAGLLTGLAYLTKPEMFLACAATFAAGMAGVVWLRRMDVRGVEVAAPVLAVAAAPLAAWLVLRATPAVLGGWQFVTPGDVLKRPMYLAGLGIDDVRNSLLKIALSAGVDAGVVGLLAAAAMAGRRAVALPVAVVLMAAVVAAGQYFPSYWVDADRALVLFAAGAVGITGWRVLCGRTPVERRIAQWLLAVLSLALLPKMMLNVRTYHYGFVLAAPCAAMLVAALVAWLPEVVRRAGGEATVARLGGMGLVAGLIVNRMIVTQMVLSERTVEIPLAMGGQLYARPIDLPAAQAVRWLASFPPQTTAAIYPDAAGIDFASGKASGLTFNVLNPMTLGMWGEENALLDLQSHPPDIILILRADTSDLGAQWFGQDYGRQVMQWIAAHYRPTETFGEADEERSIQAWQRN